MNILFDTSTRAQVQVAISQLERQDIVLLKELLRAYDPFADHKATVEGVAEVDKRLEVICILQQELSLGRTVVVSLLLVDIYRRDLITLPWILTNFGDDISSLVEGLLKVETLYAKHPVVESENFRNLLISFVQDIRVILIMIVDRLVLMRMINNHPNDALRREIAREASYLYAPLAHRIGLYKIKSELEDLSLKYTNREIYSSIAAQLKAKKSYRDQYIKSFIAPMERYLHEVGIPCSVKGRTKSIHSIWNKMRKQNIDLSGIYDLFAIRIIVECEPEREKALCWQIYSIVTDMYLPDPKRLRDWLSVPKTNGYESLHTTVMGPEGKWVEVQIRSARMNEIAEMGVAAHWKYKGGKSEGQLDQWLNNIREVLEQSDLGNTELMREFKTDLYEKEIFVFTPTGELHKLAKGATLLDFAFHIHTNLGGKCVGGKVNGRHVSMRYTLQNGDQVEVLTSSTQTPKVDWLQWVTVSRSRTKIKQLLKETTLKQAEYGKELWQRRCKNKKIEVDEPTLMRLIRKEGYKMVTDFFYDLSIEKLDINHTIEKFLELRTRETTPMELETRKAEEFVVEPDRDNKMGDKQDVLVIDQGLKGLDYTLAKCCNPIYGDAIFGFVTATGGCKIHRMNCPNAPEMISRFGYRIIPARWSGKQDSQYSVTLRVIGNDDIAIVTNISSLLGKEKGVLLRNISLNSCDGLFQGDITILISDNLKLDLIIRKITTIKGVKQVSRLQ